VQGTNIHRATGDSVAYQQKPLKSAIFFSMLRVSAASRSASCENMPELAAYQLSARIRSIRRLNLLVYTSNGIHRKGKIRMQIALQCVMQVLKFFCTSIDLRHVAIERNNVCRLHNLLSWSTCAIGSRSDCAPPMPDQACPRPSHRAPLSHATTS
jgi:hypothetical protein